MRELAPIAPKNNDIMANVIYADDIAYQYDDSTTISNVINVAQYINGNITEK